MPRPVTCPRERRRYASGGRRASRRLGIRRAVIASGVAVVLASAVVAARALWFPPVALALPGLPLPGGEPGGPVSSLGQGLTGLASSATGLGLTAIVSWVSDGAAFVLHETAHVLADTTAPRLTSTWFSAAYWRVASVATVVTLPFLCAASVQALIRSDLMLLARAAIGYLPLAMLAIAIAAPLTMLLLAASDQLAAAVSSAAGGQGVSFLDRVVGPVGAVRAFSGSPFLAFLVGLFIVAGALMLWIELLMREAAVYVIVLMLPLVFAAFVWPARRIWAVRSVELLVALILSKFAIVAVLSLGGAALGHSVHHDLGGVLAGMVLLILSAFAPWALLRLLPLAELASGTAGVLRGHSGTAFRALKGADGLATVEAQRWAALANHVHRAADVGQAPRSAPHETSTPDGDRGGRGAGIAEAPVEAGGGAGAGIAEAAGEVSGGAVRTAAGDPESSAWSDPEPPPGSAAEPVPGSDPEPSPGSPTEPVPGSDPQPSPGSDPERARGAEPVPPPAAWDLESEHCLELESLRPPPPPMGAGE